MTKTPPAKLGSTIVVKGQAKPVNLTDAVPVIEPTSTEANAAEQVPVTTAQERSTVAVTPQESITAGATKSMTVKVDIATYKKLKNHGTAIDKTSQDIFVAALALYFKTNKI